MTGRTTPTRGPCWELEQPYLKPILGLTSGVNRLYRGWLTFN